MDTIFWIGDEPKNCELVTEHSITTEFIDGKVGSGGWAIMCPKCHKEYAAGRLGVGYGQRYRKHRLGGWQKVEG